MKLVLLLRPRLEQYNEADITAGLWGKLWAVGSGTGLGEVLRSFLISSKECRALLLHWRQH